MLPQVALQPKEFGRFAGIAPMPQTFSSTNKASKEALISSVLTNGSMLPFLESLQRRHFYPRLLGVGPVNCRTRMTQCLVSESLVITCCRRPFRPHVAPGVQANTLDSERFTPGVEAVGSLSGGELRPIRKHRSACGQSPTVSALRAFPARVERRPASSRRLRSTKGARPNPLPPAPAAA